MQEPFLFATSVRENIRYGRPARPTQEVEEAARAAFIHDEVAGAARGLRDPRRDRGRPQSRSGSSSGSTSRARLLKNAPILLLDEATSALDSIAEAEVQRAIERLVGRTSFVIAHRLSTLRNADRLLVIDRRRLAGFAPHEELLATCEVYQRLWEAQQIDGRVPAR